MDLHILQGLEGYFARLLILKGMKFFRINKCGRGVVARSREGAASAGMVPINMRKDSTNSVTCKYLLLSGTGFERRG